MTISGAVVFVLAAIGLLADLNQLGILPKQEPVSQDALASNERNGDGIVPPIGRELSFITEHYSFDQATGELYFTIWNQHPTQRVRITNFQIVELARISTESYCCPSYRTELALKLRMQTVYSDTVKPLMETHEILPQASHSFKATVEVERGYADNNPVVFFGVEIDYSTASGKALVGRSDLIYVANDRSASVYSYDRQGILQPLESVEDWSAYGHSVWFDRLTVGRLLAWFPCPWTDSYVISSTSIGKPGSIKGLTDVGYTSSIRYGDPKFIPGFQVPAPSISPEKVIDIELLGIIPSNGDTPSEPVSLRVERVQTKTWDQLIETFPSAVLSCDAQRVVDHHDAKIVEVVLSLTNMGTRAVYSDYQTSGLVLRNNGNKNNDEITTLVPPEVIEQPTGIDYFMGDVQVFFRVIDKEDPIEPGDSRVQVLYFAPILAESTSLFLNAPMLENFSMPLPATSGM